MSSNVKFIVITRNSSYEIDLIKNRIRRIFNFKTISYRSSMESWKSFDTISDISLGEPLFIKWTADDYTEEQTITSCIMKIVEPRTKLQLMA